MMEDVHNDFSIDFWAFHRWLDSLPRMKKMTVTMLIVYPAFIGLLCIEYFPLVTLVLLTYLCFMDGWRAIYLAIREKVIDFGDRPNKTIN
jgi:hypothetical protein